MTTRRQFCKTAVAAAVAVAVPWPAARVYVRPIPFYGEMMAWNHYWHTSAVLNDHWADAMRYAMMDGSAAIKTGRIGTATTVRLIRASELYAS